MAAIAAVETREWSAETIEIYATNFDDLVSLAWRSCGRSELAEEVVQDAFLKYCSNNYSPAPGKELAYLRSMVVNGARSAARRDARRVELTETLPAPVPAPAIDDQVAAKLEADRAKEVVEQLPRGQRLVLSLRYLVGLSERETAAAMQVSHGTVKQQSSRGRESARTALLENHTTHCLRMV